jgi:hypothetical protein
MKGNSGLSSMRGPPPIVNSMTAGLHCVMRAVGGFSASRDSARQGFDHLVFSLGRTAGVALVARRLGQTSITLPSDRRENFPVSVLFAPLSRVCDRRPSAVVRRVRKGYVGLVQPRKAG